MRPAFHEADPDALPTSNPAAIAYMREVERRGENGPLPLRQLRYGVDPRQRIDVYAPPDADGRPILLFLHGGAWIHGHLGWLRFMAEPVLKHGAILVAATYRLAPRDRWPAQRDDAREALQFVADHAADWGGDPARVVIGGHSAGGQLAAMVALEEGRPPVAGCFPVSAPLDLRHGDVPLESEAGRVYRYLLARREDDTAASPLAQAHRARVPFHLLWGECDIDYVARAGRGMTEVLAGRGIPVSADILPGASHFDTHLSLGDPASPWYHRLTKAFSGELQ